METESEQRPMLDQVSAVCGKRSQQSTKRLRNEAETITNQAASIEAAAVRADRADEEAIEADHAAVVVAAAPVEAVVEVVVEIVDVQARAVHETTTADTSPIGITKRANGALDLEVAILLSLGAIITDTTVDIVPVQRALTSLLINPLTKSDFKLSISTFN